MRFYHEFEPILCIFVVIVVFSRFSASFAFFLHSFHGKLLFMVIFPRILASSAPSVHLFHGELLHTSLFIGKYRNLANNRRSSGKKRRFQPAFNCILSPISHNQCTLLQKSPKKFQSNNRICSSVQIIPNYT